MESIEIFNPNALITSNVITLVEELELRIKFQRNNPLTNNEMSKRRMLIEFVLTCKDLVVVPIF